MLNSCLVDFYEPEELTKKQAKFAEDPIYSLELDGLLKIKDEIFEDFLDEVYGTCTRIDTHVFIDKLSSTYSDYLYPPFLRMLVAKKIGCCVATPIVG